MATTQAATRQTGGRAMSWRAGAMAGRSNLAHLLKKRTPKQDHYYRTPVVIDQGDSTLSAAHALWHWLVTHERAFIGLSPEGLAGLVPSWAPGKPTPTFEQLISMLMRNGIVASCYWTNNAALVREAIQQGVHGPLLIGCGWFEGMLAPDSAGEIQPSGRHVGRHACLAVGYDVEREAVRLLNSWGPAWGELGRAWLPLDDLATLLRAGGEACLPILARGLDAAEASRRLHLLLRERG